MSYKRIWLLIIFIVVLLILIGITVINMAQNKGEQISKDYLALREGEHVIYRDNSGIERDCVVLYDSKNVNYSKYGVQIITVEIVKDDLELGNGTGDSKGTTDEKDFIIAKDSYNNAIKNLNSEAEKYINSDLVLSARCVGSMPDNSNLRNEKLYTNNYSYFSSYNDLFELGEDVLTPKNYNVDKQQMDALQITKTESNYWLASRYVEENGEHVGLSVRTIVNGYVNFWYLCIVNSYNKEISYSHLNGLRPVFILQTNIKVDEINGKKVLSN